MASTVDPDITAEGTGDTTLKKRVLWWPCR
jgi:hypothetical protein